MNFLIRLLISGLIAYVLSKILSGVHIDNIGVAIIFALVLAFLNAIVKPILIFLTFPVTIITLGLFLFVINACIILLAAKLMDGITIDGFWWALLFSSILSIFSSGTNAAFREGETKK
ncbi:MAG: phage holin family protein [Ferruginibacter sp.]|nr:phage holin family protein [Ferruginibacter sp.]